MILRELITLIGFRVETAPLKVYDIAVKQVQDTAFNMVNVLQNAFNSLTTSINRIGLGAKISFAGMAAAGLTATAKVEKNQAAFEVMLKSQEKAKVLMADLFKFESKTPFNLEQVITAANKLLIAKEPAENVTNQLRLLGDVAAGDAQRLQSIVYVLGQVRALGYLQGQDIMQFTNALVPIREAIAKVTGVEGEALQKLIEQRKITADMTQKALELIAEERAGMMERQSRTLGGLWSSLMSAIFRLRTAIGDALRYAFNVDKIILTLIKWTNKLTGVITGMSDASKKMIGWFTLIFTKISLIIAPIIFISKALFLIKIGMIAINFLLGALHWILAGLGLFGIKVTLTMFLPILSKIAAMLGLMALKFIVIGAVIAGILIVIEDVVGYFMGKKSVIIPAILKFLDFLKQKFLDFTGMPEEIFDMLVSDTLKGIDNLFTKIIEKIAQWYVKVQELVHKYGLINLILGTNPVTMLPHALANPKKSPIVSIANQAGSAWQKGINTGGLGYQFLININGLNVTTPPGNTQQQNESIKSQTKKAATELSEEVQKAIVRRLNSARKG